MEKKQTGGGKGETEHETKNTLKNAEAKASGHENPSSNKPDELKVSDQFENTRKVCKAKNSGKTSEMFSLSSAESSNLRCSLAFWPRGPP